jgi:hypothetical protein
MVFPFSSRKTMIDYLPLRLGNYPQDRGTRPAREELQRAEQFAFDMLGQRRAREETPPNALDAEFPAGTIVACPECGEGLYKTTTRVTTADLVLDDGTLLTPLNRSIPAKDVWAPLACPFCGGRLLNDGRIYTLQQGWR